MGLLTLREEIILCALVTLGGNSRGAPIRKMVIELTKKGNRLWHPLQFLG